MLDLTSLEEPGGLCKTYGVSLLGRHSEVSPGVENTSPKVERQWMGRYLLGLSRSINCHIGSSSGENLRIGEAVR